MITPIYEIRRDDGDLTSVIKDKLISLTIEDRRDPRADTLDLTLDFDGSYAIPRAGVVLEAKIGYAEEGLWDAGKFYVEETEFSGGANAADTLNIRGTSAPLSPQGETQSLASSHKRGWQTGTTLGAIINEVCRGARLTAKIDPTIASIEMPYTTQIGESDVEFLYSILQLYDVTLKFHDKQVIVEARDSGAIGEINISRTGTVTSYAFTAAERSKVASVVAKYQDKDAGMVAKYTAGEGEPEIEHRNTLPDRETAVYVAETILKHEIRKTHYVQLVMPTPAGLFAEKIINLTDFPDASLNRRYVVERVTHRLSSSGLSSTIRAQRHVE